MKCFSMQINSARSDQTLHKEYIRVTEYQDDCKMLQIGAKRQSADQSHVSRECPITYRNYSYFIDMNSA
jgi:hypothetical protein